MYKISVLWKVAVDLVRVTERSGSSVNKGGAWKTPFAFADCVLNQRFIDQQWWGPGGATYLIRSYYVLN